MTIDHLLSEYGWLGFLVYLVYREAWPFFRDRMWPQKIKEQNIERMRLQKLEERSVLAEERQAKAIESTSLSIQQMALAISTENERISQIISMQNEHARFTVEAIGDMRVSVAAMHAPEVKRTKR